MKYRDLKRLMYSLDSDQLDMDVTIQFNGEFYPTCSFKIVNNSDVLDEGHPVIVSLDE